VRLWLQCANLSLLVGLPGMGALLDRFAAGVMRIAGTAPSQLRAAVMHVRAGQAIGAGRLDEAWQWLQRADEDCQWLGRPRLLMTDNSLTHVLLHALRGEAEACFRHGQQAHQDMMQHGAPSHRRVHMSDVLAARMRAAWLLGDEAALRRVDTLLHEAEHPWEWAAAPRCRAWSRAFIALLEGRLDEARALLEPMAHDIERYRYYAGAQARFMLADILVRQGDVEGAARLLRAWLDQAAQGGDVGGALFAGGAVLQRLTDANWGGRLTDAQCDRLRHLRRLLGMAPPAPAAAEKPAALSALSEREQEVLERIAAGDSNKLIARAFDLSPHTVKRHVANILDKLGVDTRGQAAARWRELR
jgi:LuxR family maltose regulon positive regulatory protein